VKVSNVGTIVRGDKNMVEINGYDLTNNKGFKKAFFETKRDGGRTKNAEISDGLSQGDFIEVTCDDTSWANVQFIKKIAEPAGGASAPDMGTAPAAGGGTRANSSDKMSKAEWAAKDAKKEIGVARSVAIKSAALMCSGTAAAPSKKLVETMEKLAYRIEAYLLNGDFNADLAAVVEPEVSPKVETASPAEGNQAEGAGPASGSQDDDIPF
jgi:hypothetical protein